MADFKSFKTGYWDYYIELEERMIETKRYVEFDTQNHNTFSSNYLMLFQNVCSEIDVVGKEIATHFNSGFESENRTKSINRWWYEIQDNLPDINKEIVFAGAFSVHPWDKYRIVKVVSQKSRNGMMDSIINYNLQSKSNGITYATPKWWNDYNKVKHKRLMSDGEGVNFKKANLYNLANAYGALYLLEFEFMKHIGTVQERAKCDESILFGMEDLQNAFIDNLFVD